MVKPNRFSFFKRLTDADIQKTLKIILIVLLAALECVLFINTIKALTGDTTIELMVLIVSEVALFGVSFFNMFYIEHGKVRGIIFAVDSALLLVIMYLSDGAYVMNLFLIILSDYYFNTRSSTKKFIMGVGGYVVYAASIIAIFWVKGTLSALVAADLLSDFVIYFLYYVIFNMATALYGNNRIIKQSYEEIRKKSAALENAYLSLQQVTALEERNRIAKDIHDTAGHSMTTVIMQTEAARLALESANVEDAKRRVAAANMQAKAALEEIRECVHCLSGDVSLLPLSDKLKNIIESSVMGTDLVIRSNIAEVVTAGDEQDGFLCNSLREGISNGLRHGQSTAFFFELEKSEGMLKFLLNDNGKGTSAIDFNASFGLSKMREKAVNLGGTCEFEFAQDEGFEIRIALPFDESLNKVV